MQRPATQLAFALIALSSPLLLSAPAQESAVSPISTERPGAGLSPDVIPGGSLQVENGSGINAQRHQFTFDLPQSLFRLGFFNHFEIRYQTSNALYSSRLTPASPQWQTADTQISGKALIGRPNGLAPRSAVLSLSIPTGGVSETTGTYDPGAVLIWTQTPPRGWFLNEVAMATLTTLNGARRPIWAPSIATGKALNPRLTLFAECAPTLMQDDSVIWTVDSGFTFLRGATQQFDFRGGYLKDSAGAHILMSVGLSMRRDHLLKLFRPLPIRR